MKMKHRLFDLVITLSIAAAISSTAVTVSAIPSNEISRSNNGHCDNAASPTINEPIFQVGDIVEVYDPKIHPAYAFFAKIDQVSPGRDGGPIQYSVQVGFAGGGGNALYENIGASAIRPMEPFTEITHAMCDDGKTLNAMLFPCTVDFHLPNSKNVFGEGSRQKNLPSLYSVSFQQDGEWQKKIMPIARIRRIVRDEETCFGGGNTCNDAASEERGDLGTFSPGSPVEIYGPGSFFAVPATVTGVTPDNLYNLIHGITQVNLKNIEAQFVHPYRVYDKGTEASCNVGETGEMIMVPCIIQSPVEESNRGGEIVYRVLTKNLGKLEKERVVLLPRTKLQRYHAKPKH